MVLGTSFGFVYLTSSFLQDVLDEDIWHVNVLARLGDVQIAFGNFFLMFCPKTFLFLMLFPPY